MRGKIFYREMKNPELFSFLERVSQGKSQSDIDAAIGSLFELAVNAGFDGCLWQDYLAYELAANENAFSLSCEGRPEEQVSAGLRQAAGYDLELFYELFHADLKKNVLQDYRELWQVAENYGNTDRPGRMWDRAVLEAIENLAENLARSSDLESFTRILCGFYQRYGVGFLGLHRAFLLDEYREDANLVPVTQPQPMVLGDLVGYESQKQKLRENTEAFLAGRQANNCLLYGDAGTGKSSSVKALLNEYYDKGLRMIAVYKHQVRRLPALIQAIKDRNYKFILFMDDLSFEDFEVEYKYLKAVIEGSVEKKPENVLIYATSNRRHLIREKFSDKREIQDDLHGNDTVQEKLSLASRFGLQILFSVPKKTDFQEIVLTLAKRQGLEVPEEELLLEANSWELRHGGRTGRTAVQFITWMSDRAAGKKV